MLIKLMLLATAAAAVTATATGVATNTANEKRSKIRKMTKAEPLPEQGPELPEERGTYLNDPTARAYEMDYMYV